MSDDTDLAEMAAEDYSDPLRWVETAFPWGEPGPLERESLRTWQREYLTHLGKEIEGRGFNGADPVMPIETATASGHGIGKSALTSWVILFLMSTRANCRGVVTANTGDQLRTKTWSELAKWHGLCITGHWFDLSSGKGNLSLVHKESPTTWRTDAQTCREENSESFAGLHNRNSTAFYLFDEASAIPDKIWEVSDGGLTDGEPMRLAFGNPTRPDGRFCDCWSRGDVITRNIDSREVEGANLEYLNALIDYHGEESDEAKVRVRGQFPSTAENQFIAGHLIDSAVSAEDVSEDKGAPTVIGVDVARFGSDSSVIYVRVGKDARSVPPLMFKGLDLMAFAHEVACVVDRLNPEGVFIDGGGVGGGVIDRLRQMGYSVTDVQFGGAARNQSRWRNRRIEMWGDLALWLEHGGVIPKSLPGDYNLAKELSGPRYRYSPSGQKVLESKDEMKARGAHSPDVADALALTFANKVARRDIVKSRRRRRSAVALGADGGEFGW